MNTGAKGEGEREAFGSSCPLGWVPELMDVSLSEFWEMVMNREAWSAAIHGVAKSRTRLSD